MERCYHLDDTLARLARLYPSTKFIRSRAAALGFASKPSSSARTRAVAPARRSKISRDDDEDDPYGDDEDDERSPVDDDDDDDVDLDVLPTMLVYRDGELVHNWVRVDWEAGQAGVEELLDQYVTFMPLSQVIVIDTLRQTSYPATERINLRLREPRSS